MTDHSPTDLTNPSYAELLAKIALLEQQQKQQQDAYQQRLQEWRSLDGQGGGGR